MVSIVEYEKQIIKFQKRIMELEGSTLQGASSLLEVFSKRKIQNLKAQKELVIESLNKRIELERDIFNRLGLYLSDEGMLMDRYVRALCIKVDLPAKKSTFKKLRNHNYVTFGFNKKENRMMVLPTLSGQKNIGNELDFWETGVGAKTAKNVKVINFALDNISSFYTKKSSTVAYSITSNDSEKGAPEKSVDKPVAKSKTIDNSSVTDTKTRDGGMKL